MKSLIDQRPVFINEEVNFLYEYDYHIPEEIINKILCLPRESLIQDLHLVLEDVKKRKDVFDNHLQNKWFPAHAILLLKELKSTESLEIIVHFLQFEYESMARYVHDILDENIISIFSVCGVGRLNALKEFILSDNYSLWIKKAIAESVSMQGLTGLISKEEASLWNIDILRYYRNSTNPTEDQIDFIGNVVCGCMDLKSVESLEIIEELYNKELVDPVWTGDLDEIRDSITTPDLFPLIHNNASIFETYQQYKGKDSFFNSFLNTPYVRESPKTGRNDLCPCGSGKKFKKCHGAE
jgi:hypothetical protein